MANSSKAERDIDNLFNFLMDVVENPSMLAEVKEGSTLKFIEEESTDSASSNENVTVVSATKNRHVVA